VIAKLDRHSRDAAFLPTLCDSGVRLLAVDMPEASDLTVGIMVPVADESQPRGRPTTSVAGSPILTSCDK
jgi:hypothetical protein